MFRQLNVYLLLSMKPHTVYQCLIIKILSRKFLTWRTIWYTNLDMCIFLSNLGWNASSIYFELTLIIITHTYIHKPFNFDKIIITITKLICKTFSIDNTTVWIYNYRLDNLVSTDRPCIISDCPAHLYTCTYLHVFDYLLTIYATNFLKQTLQVITTHGQIFNNLMTMSHRYCYT